MAVSLSRKLRIADNASVLLFNPPANFEETFKRQLPPGASLVKAGEAYDQVHWFVQTKSQLEKEISKVLKLLKEDMIVWIYYPKGSSGRQTDLTRDKGWDCLHAEEARLTWLSLISYDDTWSVFGLRVKTRTDKKKQEDKPAQREIFNWVNPATKEIKLPGDLAAAFRRNKKEAAFFETLSFTNKKEYIEWIVTAKRTETRSERVSGTIGRLAKNWKNPRNI